MLGPPRVIRASGPSRGGPVCVGAEVWGGIVERTAAGTRAVAGTR